MSGEGNERAAARVAGVAFIVASVAAIVGGGLLVSVDDASSLTELAGDRTTLATGVVLELVLVAAVVTIAVALHPVLRRVSETLALGYVAARVVEAVVLLAATLAALVAIAVGDTDLPDRAAADQLVVATREWTYLVGSLILLGVGGLILYSLLYRGRLVPTWLSLWGLVGAALILARGVVELYVTDLSAVAQGLLAAPIGINEMVLAVWLIIRGAAPRVAGDEDPPVSSSVRRGVEQSGSSSGS